MEGGESRDEFWNTVMTQAYDVFVDRILNHLKVSVMGSIVLSRDVEAIRTFCEEAAGKVSNLIASAASKRAKRGCNERSEDVKC